MWRWNALLALVLLSGGSSLLADEPPAGSLIARSDWVHFQLNLGQLRLGNIVSSQTRSASLGDPDGESYERLLLSSDTETPSLRYQHVTREAVVSIEVIDGDRVVIHQSPTAGSDRPTVHFAQLPGRDVTFHVEDGTGRRTYQARDLWQLMFHAWEDFDDQLVPILEWAQPSWHFEPLVRQTEDELARQAQASAFTARKTAARLVAQLDADIFAQRLEAENKLLSLGIVVLPYLDQIDGFELSREQQIRIARVRERLRVDSPDTPQRIAAWLAEDEATWLAMLDHDELAMREIAAAHLAKRVRGELPFTPDAEPAARAEQVAGLRAKLLR